MQHITTYINIPICVTLKIKYTRMCCFLFNGIIKQCCVLVKQTCFLPSNAMKIIVMKVASVLAPSSS